MDRENNPYVNSDEARADCHLPLKLDQALISCWNGTPLGRQLLQYSRDDGGWLPVADSQLPSGRREWTGNSTREEASGRSVVAGLLLALVRALGERSVYQPRVTFAKFRTTEILFPGINLHMHGEHY